MASIAKLQLFIITSYTQAHSPPINLCEGQKAADRSTTVLHSAVYPKHYYRCHLNNSVIRAEPSRIDLAPFVLESFLSFFVFACMPPTLYSFTCQPSSFHFILLNHLSCCCYFLYHFILIARSSRELIADRWMPYFGWHFLPTYFCCNKKEHPFGRESKHGT